MKKIIYIFSLALITIFTSCKDSELPQANWISDEIAGITANPGDMSVTLNWTPSENTNVEGYYITYSPDGEPVLLDANVFTYTINNLTNGTQYIFSVQADYGKIGKSGKKSVKSIPVTSRFPVTNLIIAAGHNAIKTTWAKPDVDNVLGYIIRLMPGDISIEITDPNTLSKIINDLTNDVEYTVSVYAKYAIGNSEPETSKATPGNVLPINPVKTHVLENESNQYAYNDLYFTKDISSVTWDFGDGTTSTEMSPSHAYSSPGKYEVSMTANYADGTNATASIYTIVIGYKWEFIFNEYIAGITYGQVKSNTPVFAPDGTIYICLTGGGSAGNLIAINPDGTLKWSFDESTSYVYGAGPVLGDDGTIYFGSRDHKLYAVNPDGTKKWSYDCGTIIYCFPAIASDGSAYFIDDHELLNAVSPSGTLLWQVQLDQYTGPVAIGSNGNIYAGTRGSIYCFDNAGNQIWKTTSALCTEKCSFAMSGNTLYAAQRDSKGLLALSMSTGSSIWVYTDTGIDDIYSPIVGKDGTIYFGCKGKKGVYAVYPDGTLKWNLPTGCSHNYSHPVIDENNIVYISSQADPSGSSHIFAINGDDGSIQWQIPRSSVTIMQTGSSISPDGVLYVPTQGNTTEQGRLLAIDIFAGPETSSWSVRGGNRYGNSRQ